MNKFMRQAHRWLSIIFTVVVVINIGALVAGSQATWVGFLALPPLLLMLISGLYLFVLPYTSKARAARAELRTE